MIARNTFAAFALSAPILLPVAIAHADTVTDWNQTAIRATETAGAPVPVQTRVMSIVHAAVFDAVNALERKYWAYAVDIQPSGPASAEAAAAAAAHGILERTYPQQKSIFDAALTASLAQIADGALKENGVELGKTVAEKTFALRREDGAAAQQTYSFGSGSGVYQATPPMTGAPMLAHWRQVKPFTLASATQLTFPGPPEVGSPSFARDLDEIRRLGGKASTERTNEQTAIAIHWAGSEVPPFNAIARTAAAAKKLGLSDNARLFALLNMTMADALIAGFEAKYHFNYWRPFTAIRNAPTDLNSTWQPLLVTPPHPEYPSAHCLGAGAAVTVLQDVLGGDTFASSFVYPPLGVSRRWESFSQIATEVENARVWGGIHFRTSTEHGTQLGRQVAAFALETKMQPAPK